MHRCLTIMEILDEICAHLDPTPHPDRLYGFDSSSEGRRTFWDSFRNKSTQPSFSHLLNVARTSKAFHARSVQFMWRSATLGNLLACLPADLCVVDKASPEYKIRLLRPFQKGDWERTSIYTAYVRHLFSGSDEWSLSDILPCMSLCIPPNIFPVLQSLIWNHPNDQFSYIGTFLSPAITTLSFPPTPESLSLLSALPFKCPHLKDFAMYDVGAEESSPEELHAISSFLCELSDVESISVSQLNQTAMAHIARLPNLKALTFGDFPEDWSAPAVDIGQAFASLRELVLCYPAMNDTIAFLEQWFSQVPLTYFYTFFSTSADTSQMDILFSALSAGILHHCLSRLWIQSQTPNPWASDSYHVENRSFRRLFCFIGLTSVMIEADGGFDIDDSTMSELSRAWPLIQTLELRERRYFPQTRVTLACLSSLAANCPRLTELQMSFNTNSVPCSTNNLAHCLKLLSVGHSPLSPSTVVPVALFLSANFPGLERLKTVSHMPRHLDEFLQLAEARESRRSWKEVEVLVCHGGLGIDDLFEV
ncbi:hypothetical protein B0H12DRAFT_1158040 [Mycena haematopus]|nr:hypothetical protein B0H12DRAFT_1158040 [Mycena haematopus]